MTKKMEHQLRPLVNLNELFFNYKLFFQWQIAQAVEECQRVNVTNENDTENDQYITLLLTTKFLDKVSEVAYQQSCQQH